jgi:carboxyl-terminal processing protease
MKKNNFITRFFSNIKKSITKSKNKFTIIEVLSFMVVSFALGLIAGGIIMYGKGKFNGEISSSLDEFIATYNDILNNYYEPVDGDKLLEAGINGMVNYLGDPYSTYYTPEQSQEFNEYLDGKFCGIGSEIQIDNESNYVKLVKVYENSPAAKAGLKDNDLLIKVDGVDIKGKALSDVTAIVKGEQGTVVKLTVRRDNKDFDVEVTRDFVDIISVQGEIIELQGKKIGYIDVAIFAENTDVQFEKELKKLEEEKIDALIIDLRSNTGGHLKTVTNMISLFIKKGEVIYKLKTKEVVEDFKDLTEEHREYPIAILINEISASASEVFTAALKEQYGALVIGATSYGKGKVQKSYQLSSGAMIKFTYQEWLTPKGDYIDGKGIEPDIKIEYKQEKERDSQLNRALQELVK